MSQFNNKPHSTDINIITPSLWTPTNARKTQLSAGYSWGQNKSEKPPYLQTDIKVQV